MFSRICAGIKRFFPGTYGFESPRYQRVGAADDEVGNTVGKGIRLAGSGAGDHQQGSSDMTVGGDPVLDGPTLFRVERLKI